MSRRISPCKPRIMDSGVCSNPFSKDSAQNVPLLKRREIRPLEQNAMSQGFHSTKDTLIGQNIDESPLFNDPARVDQWVATSATGSACTGNACLSLSPIGSPTLFEYPRLDCSTFQGSEVFHNDVSLGVQYPSEAYNLCMDTNTMATTVPPTLMSEPSFASSTSSSSDLCYDIPAPVDVNYTRSNHSNLVMREMYGNEELLKSPEPSQQTAMAFQHGLPAPTLWSSPSTVSLEPSLSSSYSQGNMFSCAGSSPTSFATEDSSSNASIQDEGFLPPSLVDFAMQAPLPCTSTDDMQFDLASTIRASNCFPRTVLSDNTFWPAYQSMDVSYDGIPLDVYMSRRPSGEHDNSSARRNELYQIGPKEDGLYHCPFEASEGCKHKPEKLKCNYDKHLDSHLKPYRCKVPACGSVPFSSTACLLRHEREAHGMHGHGDRPYMCTYPDCDRALQGNGFPRRWNLMDHMKRVHDHQSTSANGRSSPTLSDNTRTSRRRRTSTSSQPSSSRVTKNSARTVTALKHKAPQKQRSTP